MPNERANRFERDVDRQEEQARADQAQGKLLPTFTPFTDPQPPQHDGGRKDLDKRIDAKAEQRHAVGLLPGEQGNARLNRREEERPIGQPPAAPDDALMLDRRHMLASDLAASSISFARFCALRSRSTLLAVRAAATAIWA